MNLLPENLGNARKSKMKRVFRKHTADNKNTKNNNSSRMFRFSIPCPDWIWNKECIENGTIRTANRILNFTESTFLTNRSCSIWKSTNQISYSISLFIMVSVVHSSFSLFIVFIPVHSWRVKLTMELRLCEWTAMKALIPVWEDLWATVFWTELSQQVPKLVS